MSGGPQDIPALDWLINMGMALLGGAIRFVKAWRDNIRTWSGKQAFIEGTLNALYAGFAALLAALLMSSWGVDKFYTAFACGIVGHMGPEGVNLLSEVISNAFRARSNLPPPSKE